MPQFAGRAGSSPFIFSAVVVVGCFEGSGLMGVDLKAIRERAEKATPGPWRAECRSVGNEENDPAWPPDDFLQFELHGPAPVMGRGDFVGRDADFIAHARSDIPDLLEHIEGLEAHVALLKASLKQATKAEERTRALEEALGEYWDAFDNRDSGHLDSFQHTAWEVFTAASKRLRALSTERMPNDG
jgi:hypothetical protein